MSKFIFKPWEDAPKKINTVALIAVSGPPCIHCEHWRPRALYTASGSLDGVRLCWADGMFSDFSCYEGRD